MPLVVVTGLPCSGKSSAAAVLQDHLQALDRRVVVVSEERLLAGHTKNAVFADSRLEKEVRGRLKSEVVRLLDKETFVICDGLNYIKGFRYELFCASKTVKTTQATVGKNKEWISKFLDLAAGALRRELHGRGGEKQRAGEEGPIFARYPVCPRPALRGARLLQSLGLSPLSRPAGRPRRLRGD